MNAEPDPDQSRGTPRGEPEGDGIAVARRVLDAQPFSRLLDARVLRFDEAAVELEVPIRAELLQQDGHLHGGVLAYAADNALTFAAGTALGPELLTSGFTIDYLRPAAGERLIARATVVHAGRRRAVCRCELFVVTGAGDETLCASAQGSAMAVQPREPSPRQPRANSDGFPRR